MRLLLRLIKSKKANKKTPSHGESVHDWGISFCVKKLEVGEGQKHRFGAVSEPVQNERNKIMFLCALGYRERRRGGKSEQLIHFPNFFA